MNKVIRMSNEVLVKVSGKSPNCYGCGALKERPESGYCHSCRKEQARQYRARKREEKGLPSFSRGGNPNCSSCGNLRENPKASYCHSCAREKAKSQERERIGKGLPSYSEGRGPNCYSCGKLKENPKQGYCYECKNAKERARTLATGKVKKHRTGKCACGNEFASYSGHECVDCYRKRRQDRKDNPDYDDRILKESVRAMTRQYVKRGILIKQPCVKCGTSENIEAHHEDYTKPLDVLWLCREHHRELHKQQLIRS